MSRRHRAEKREILPDPKFGDRDLTKFMNYIMIDGKKSAAEAIIYGALDIIEEKVKREPVRVFHEAMDNVAPEIEVRSRRVAAPPTRFRSRFVRIAARRSPFAGWPPRPGTATRTPCASGWPLSSWTPLPTAAPRSKSVKTRTRWPKPTARSRITAGNSS